MGKKVEKNLLPQTKLLHMKCVARILVVLGLAAARGWAMWADVPLEALVKKADLIVVGEVVRIEAEPAPAEDRGRGVIYERAIIEVQRVLKGPAQLKTVVLRQPAHRTSEGRPVLELSTDLTYPEGTEGVWLLSKLAEGQAGKTNRAKGRKAKDDIYEVDYPKNYQPLDQEEAIKTLLKKSSDSQPAKAPPRESTRMPQSAP